MQALKEVEKTDAVNTLVAICAICKSQFSKVLPKFDFDPYMIVSAHQLVSEAIIMDKPQTDDASFSACILGIAPLIRISIKSSVNRPPPPPQQNVDSIIVLKIS
jgi:hypothetical protein